MGTPEVARWVGVLGPYCNPDPCGNLERPVPAHSLDVPICVGVGPRWAGCLSACTLFAHRLSSRSYVKRMKEFERERRLLQRKKRRERREAEVAAGTGHGEVGPEVAL